MYNNSDIIGQKSAFDGMIPVDTIQNITDPYEIMHGYLQGPQTRGTVGIMYSCLVTISLCCWVSTFPNVPGPKDKWYHPTIDKLNMACIGILGPEFLFVIAVGQLSSALRSVRLFKHYKHLTMGLEWTLQHAFYADMGGFHISSPDYPFGFPLNAEQFHYLLKHGYIDFPNMDHVAIEQKNGTEIFSRVVATFSAVWFFIQEFQHLSDGNPITCLELTAMTFAFVMVGTSICWYYKPCIQAPFYLETKDGLTIKQIRRNAKRFGHEFYRDKWYRTPLEFIGNRKFTVTNHWAYYVRLTQRLHIPIFSRPVTSRPWDRWPSDTFDAPEPLLFPLGGIVVAGFSASFLIGWNLYFPTWAEQTMWRICAIYNAFFACFGALYFFAETMKFHWHLEQSFDLQRRQDDAHAGSTISARAAAVSRAATMDSTIEGIPTATYGADGESAESGGEQALFKDKSMNIRFIVRTMTGGLIDADGKASIIKAPPVPELPAAATTGLPRAPRLDGLDESENKTDGFVDVDWDSDDDTDWEDDGFGGNKEKYMPGKNATKETKDEVILGRPAGGLGRANTFTHLRRADTVSTTTSSDDGSTNGENDPYNQGIMRHLKHIPALLRSLTPYSDPDMRVPLRVLFPVSFVCLFYMVCRCFFYFLDFYTLRQQPIGIYWDGGF